MKLFTYASSLADVIQRTELDTDLVAMRNIIQRSATDIDTAIALPGVITGNGVLVKISSLSKSRLGVDLLPAIKKNRKNMLDNIETLLAHISKNFPDRITSRTATSRHLAYISYTEAVTNVASIITPYTIEYVKAKTRSRVKDGGVKAEYHAEDNPGLLKTASGAIWGISQLSAKPTDFRRTLDTLSDTYVSEASDDATTAIGGTATNPVTSMVSGFINNPVYHLGIYVANLRAKSYKLIDEERIQLELILQASQAELENNYSPALDRKIVSLGNRIRTKRVQLKEIRGDY